MQSCSKNDKSILGRCWRWRSGNSRLKLSQPASKKQEVPVVQWLMIVVIVMSALVTILSFNFLPFQGNSYSTIILNVNPSMSTKRSLSSPTESFVAVPTQRSTSLLVDRFQNILHKLEHSKLRFFMYNETDIVQPEKWDLQQLKQQYKMTKFRTKLWQRYYNDAAFEIMVLSQFEHHPLRTHHPDQAQVFVIPIPMGAILLGKRQTQAYQQAFSALVTSPTFSARYGHDHVLLSHTGVAFNQETKLEMETFGLSQWYPLLENVTIAQGYDVGGCYNLTRMLQRGKWKLILATPPQQSRDHVMNHRWDFVPLFTMNQVAQTKFSFSIGIGATSDIPYHAASMERWEHAPLFLFYRTGMRYFKYRSTPFRHLLMETLQNHTTKNMAAMMQEFQGTMEEEQRRLTESIQSSSSFVSLLSSHSSIGYDLPADRWIQDLTSSKFCLVLRGDTPHSHALLRAIKVGCLPVIVSDYYEEYAPIFRSTLRLSDFAIFISEQDFMTQPVESLERLRHLSQDELTVKLQVLNMVQRIVLPDHPESLFVPAFIKEAYLTGKSPPRFRQPSIPPRQLDRRFQKRAP